VYNDGMEITEYETTTPEQGAKVGDLVFSEAPRQSIYDVKGWNIQRGDVLIDTEDCFHPQEWTVWMVLGRPVDGKIPVESWLMQGEAEWVEADSMNPDYLEVMKSAF
jgi:hypothetical protein